MMMMMNVVPTTEDFQGHFESLLNPQQIPLPEINEFENSLYWMTHLI